MVFYNRHWKSALSRILAMNSKLLPLMYYSNVRSSWIKLIQIKQTTHFSFKYWTNITFYGRGFLCRELKWKAKSSFSLNVIPHIKHVKPPPGSDLWATTWFTAVHSNSNIFPHIPHFQVWLSNCIISSSSSSLTVWKSSISSFTASRERWEDGPVNMRKFGMVKE